MLWQRRERRLDPKQGRVLLIVIDGLGFNRRQCRDVASAAWERLARQDRDTLISEAAAVLRGRGAAGATPEELALLSLYPVHAETLGQDAPFADAVALTEALGLMASGSVAGVQPARRRAAALVRQAATEARYVPWMADAPILPRLRNGHLTVPTSACGVWAGYEDADPPVKGNSETGHQQIANLTLAPQTPREITASIRDGSFFTNEALSGAVRAGTSPGSALNFCFLLSGTRGDDGRVHSAWNHLEAFCELVFVRYRADPSRVRMQAVLDGRDAPARSSLEGVAGGAGYLDRLESLLARYGATESLAWVAGRSIAMDRDYREANTKADYLLLTRGEGQPASGFDGVRRAVAAAHALGTGDTDIPPLAVTDRQGRKRMIGGGEVFVDLNFRPDRQRAKVAALAGAGAFLQKEAAQRGRVFGLDWLDPGLKLRICTIAEYHPEFESSYGVKVAYQVKPQANNLLALWPEVMPDSKYLLVAESVKALHMGYFFRGRRAAPAAAGGEDRHLVPSYSEQDGVRSDSDFIRFPQMRSPEIAAYVFDRLKKGRHRLICCNLAAPDMIGHLMPAAWDASEAAMAAINAAVRAYEATDAAAGRMAEAARAAGYSVIITSDHGNIEDDGPAHSGNDVLTTVIAPSGRYAPAPRERFQARLFDVSWTVARILGVEEAVSSRVANAGPGAAASFTGRPISAGILQV
jgi:2,3-bisphosphoglycerate-independent phosphoglycerate mutase